MEGKEITVKCECNCTIIRVTLDSLDGMFTIQAYEDAYIVRQNKIKRYFERLWSSIRGRDYFLYEAVLSDKEYFKLVKFYYDKDVT